MLTNHVPVQQNHATIFIYSYFLSGTPFIITHLLISIYTQEVQSKNCTLLYNSCLLRTKEGFTTSLLQNYQFVKECIIPNCAYTKWEECTQNTWSAEGLAGGKTTEATEEDEEDLDLEGDLDLLVFLAFFFLSLLPFLDLRLEDCLRTGAAIGTEPIVPPKGVGGGIENKGTIGLAANWMLRGKRGVSSGA